jgi:serine/threonine protein kinase
MHSRNFIHRDLKPANMVMGIGHKAGLVYLIDFGLSKQFRDPKTHIHISFSNADTAHQLTGSAAFTSIHSHSGQELSRRDDLESLAYILIYFLRGSLPWQRLNEGDSLLKIKQQITAHELCLGLPVEFLQFINYTRSLSFSDKPDYGYLCSLFEGLLVRKGFQNGSSFDLDVDEITMLYKVSVIYIYVGY